MFKGSVKAGVIDDALDKVSVLVDDCRMRFSGDRLHIVARDPSNVTSAKIELESGAFEYFEADEGTIGVSITRLQKVIGIAEPEQVVHLEAGNRNLDIQTDSIDYSLRLISPEVVGDGEDFVKFELPATVTLRSETFDKIVEVTELVGDTVTLGVDESDELLYASAKNDYDDIHVELDADELHDVELGRAKSVFSIDYLRSISDAIHGDTVVSVNIGERSPAEIRYDFAGGDGHAMYHIAPRRPI